MEDPVDEISDDDDFLLNASEPALNAIWDNPEDDIYAELLEGDSETVMRKLRARRHPDREISLEELPAGVTKKNRHPEVDFGHPVGKEKL